MKTACSRHLTDNYNVTLTICAILLFICTNPYFVWRTPLILLSSWLVCLLSYKYFTINNIHIVTFLAFFVLYSIYAVINEVNFFGAAELLIIPFLFLLKKDYISDLYNRFILILSIALVPSILEYLLWLLGFSINYNVIAPYELGKTYNYQQFLFFVTSYSPFGLSRFYSYYDEPGVLGTITAMILISKQYNLRSRQNIIIFVAGILTFSFYFYVISLLAFLFSKKHKYLWAGLVLILVFGVTKIDFFEPLVNRFIIEDGKFAGDNRTNEDYDIWFSNYLQTDRVWYGYGKNYAQDLNKGGTSYKDIIVNFGLLFFIIYVSSFVLLCLRTLKRKRDRFLWIILFFSCLYQRPSIGRVEFVFIWLSSMYVIGMVDDLQISNKRLDKVLFKTKKLIHQ